MKNYLNSLWRTTAAALVVAGGMVATDGSSQKAKAAYAAISVSDAPIPAQYIAKLYTEALGRASDQSGWIDWTNYFYENGCSRTTLENAAVSTFTSTEFKSLGYDNASTTLLLYRTILNREPDAPGFKTWLQKLNSGTSLQQAVSSFILSAEFAKLVPRICNQSSYGFSSPAGALAIQIPIVGDQNNVAPVGISEANLQTLLNKTPAGQTVWLAQHAVVYAVKTLVIPPGVTLATEGTPLPNRHGEMARIIRMSDFPTSLVEVSPGAVIKSLWIDGQRGVLSPETVDTADGAINIQVDAGAGTSVVYSFISNTDGWSSLHSLEFFDGTSCTSNIIQGNLVTSYPSLHYNTPGYTDGLSIGCGNSTVTENQIVDPTDVGIVTFTAFPDIQRSTIAYNTVINVGNSTFAALATDTGQGLGGPGDFTGTNFKGNLIWTGPHTHFVLGLVAGAREWWLNGNQGYGVSFTDNTTGSLSVTTNTAIIVAGMSGAQVFGNTMTSNIEKISNCPSGKNLLDPALASQAVGVSEQTLTPMTPTQQEATPGCISDLVRKPWTNPTPVLAPTL